MNSFVALLDSFLLEINKSINEKIIGINYLENIKFLLIEKLQVLDKLIFDDFIKDISIKKTFSNNREFNNKKVNYTINYLEKSVIKIKSKIEEDSLFIVLDGLKIITIFDKNNQDKSIKAKIFKNMGFVLSQGSIINENNNKKSIILQIINKVS